jgi:hypothetical protein
VGTISSFNEEAPTFGVGKGRLKLEFSRNFGFVKVSN